MKALFIGLGSIGQRHLQNFLELRPTYSPVLAYRTSNSEKIIKNGIILTNKKFSEYYMLNEYFEIDQALNENPDIAFICNPSSLHMETAIKIAENNINFFVEKPLSINTNGINDLTDLIIEKNITNMIGYQTRFNPIINEVKDVLMSMDYGRVINAEFSWCTYLPNHHPYEDYRNGYAARKDLGGGVVTCLSHELDLIQWFFGVPISVYAAKGGSSKLDMDVEDDIAAIFKCKNIDNVFPVNLHLSFVQGFEKRGFSILFQDALLNCNLVKNEIQIIGHDNNLKYQNNYNDLNRNFLFKKEMEEFLKAVEKKENTSIPISEGKKSLLMALAIHKSLETGNLEEILF